jgi:simple sugar transport system substrate-binding protein
MAETGFSRRDFLKAGGVGIAGAALFGAAGCGGGQQSEGTGAAGLTSRGDIRIEFVSHGPASDPFWSVVINGIDQAKKDLGVEVNYRAPDTYDVPQIQQNFESAIASNPSGIAATVADADAFGPKVRKAVNKGIPVVLLNAGLDVWEKLGALNYVGQTEFEAGVEAGKRMADAGVKSALCINHQQGVSTLDQRCGGFDKGLGGSVKQVAVNGNDPTAAQNGIETALKQNPDVEGMLTLGPQGAIPGLKALKSSGKSGSLEFGTFDLSPEILSAIRDGKMLFAVDQQQFLQGYLPVAILTDYVQYLLHPIGVIPTGPAFVTKEDAQKVINLSKKGIR